MTEQENGQVIGQQIIGEDEKAENYDELPPDGDDTNNVSPPPSDGQGSRTPMSDAAHAKLVERRKRSKPSMSQSTMMIQKRLKEWNFTVATPEESVERFDGTRVIDKVEEKSVEARHQAPKIDDEHDFPSLG